MYNENAITGDEWDVAHYTCAYSHYSIIHIINRNGANEGRYTSVYYICAHNTGMLFLVVWPFKLNNMILFQWLDISADLNVDNCDVFLTRCFILFYRSVLFTRNWYNLSNSRLDSWKQSDRYIIQRIIIIFEFSVNCYAFSNSNEWYHSESTKYTRAIRPFIHKRVRHIQGDELLLLCIALN